MADIVYYNSTDPEMQVKVTFSTHRDRDNLTITASVYERFVGGNTPPYDFPGGSSLPYCGSGTGLYTGWKLTFKMSSGGASSSVVMKNNSKWMWSSEKSRTRTCSMTIKNTSDSARVSCEIVTSNSKYTAGTMPTKTKNISVSSFEAPSAPTWININPNPCNINSRPSITWGGARAGSMGVLEYDLDVNSTKPNGSWTGWKRLLAATGSTSYTNPVLNSMNVNGQKPFNGVKYQYRVRCWDGSYSNSGWKYSDNLTVSFVAPTAPTTFSWDTPSVKKDGDFTISWSGASGGSGSISQYNAEFLYYTKENNTWTNYGSIYTGNLSYYSGSLETLFPNAKNGDKIQIRVRTYNTWDMWSSFNNSSALSVRANQIWIKVNGAWVEGNCYIKSSGAWVEGMPYIKSNGEWKEST